MEIRALDAADVAQYRSLRLRALREHPEAFGASDEEEAAFSDEQMAARLRPPGGGFVAGAFDGGQLLGMLALSRYAGAKIRHKAILVSMYVSPEARGRGVGAALLDDMLARARALDGLTDLVLAVTVGNETARRLYLAAGFRPYGVEPRFIRVGQTYHDIEWMHLRLHQ